MISPVDTIDELRDLYSLIEEGVKAINEHRKKPAEIFAPDIYRGIANGDCRAIVIHDDTDLWGWATYYVAKKSTGDRFGIALNSYIRSQAPKTLLGEAIDYMEKDCMSEGARNFSMQSSRIAWQRRLAPLGYELELFTFTKRL